MVKDMKKNRLLVGLIAAIFLFSMLPLARGQSTTTVTTKTLSSATVSINSINSSGRVAIYEPQNSYGELLVNGSTPASFDYYSYTGTLGSAFSAPQGVQYPITLGKTGIAGSGQNSTSPVQSFIQDPWDNPSSSVSPNVYWIRTLNSTILSGVNNFTFDMNLNTLPTLGVGSSQNYYIENIGLVSSLASQWYESYDWNSLNWCLCSVL